MEEGRSYRMEWRERDRKRERDRGRDITLYRVSTSLNLIKCCCCCGCVVFDSISYFHNPIYGEVFQHGSPQGTYHNIVKKFPYCAIHFGRFKGRSPMAYGTLSRQLILCASLQYTSRKFGVGN